MGNSGNTKQTKETNKKTHCLLKLKLNKIAVALLHCILFLWYYIWLSLIQSFKKKKQKRNSVNNRGLDKYAKITEYSCY